MEKTECKERLHLIDAFRGITILSMIGFHTCWDLYYFNMGITASFLQSRGAHIWQQSICWSFIILSGYCFHLGHHHLKRGLMSLVGGILITIVTLIVLPEERDVFGVLWMLGTSMLLMIPLDKILPKNRVAGIIGLLISGLLFFVTRDINKGFLGFEGFELVKLPSGLYKGYPMTFLGFTDQSFYSSDYFSVMPWFFLFCFGYFLKPVLENTFFEKKILTKKCKPFELIGRHSFLIYMLHQVVIYGVVWGIYTICCN